jgi:uncharacterized membrane protein YtjA (UPF0391 family)
MLFWIIIFFIFAVIAGILWLTGMAASATGIAKMLFFIFLGLFVLSLFVALLLHPPAEKIDHRRF